MYIQYVKFLKKANNLEYNKHVCMSIFRSCENFQGAVPFDTTCVIGAFLITIHVHSYTQGIHVCLHILYVCMCFSKEFKEEKVGVFAN